MQVEIDYPAILDRVAGDLTRCQIAVHVNEYALAEVGKAVHTHELRLDYLAALARNGDIGILSIEASRRMDHTELTALIEDLKT